MITKRVRQKLDRADFDPFVAEAIEKVVEALETYTQDSPHTRASKALAALERALDGVEK